MPLLIAEYLGQRTDVDPPQEQITPASTSHIPNCPFMGVACTKIAQGYKPVCSVRVQSRYYSGQPFIVCSKRLLPSRMGALSPYQLKLLNAVAHHLLPGVPDADVLCRPETGIVLGPGRRLYLDYVIQANPAINYTNGPSKIIMEIQGGGETSNTGFITDHVSDWEKKSPPTNVKLRGQVIVPSGKSTPGIIPDNAWKRQLTQILKKSVLARHFGGAFALVMGEILFDYVKTNFPNAQAYWPGWEVALIRVSENTNVTPTAGMPIPIEQVTSTLFMTHADFIAALQDFPIEKTVTSPFNGDFLNLLGSHIQVDSGTLDLTDGDIQVI
ncbi:MAG: hypothetical protein V4671_03485 [Armatimonadota bacterium]